MITPNPFALAKKVRALHNYESDGAKYSPRLFLEMIIHAFQKSSHKGVCVWNDTIHGGVLMEGLCRTYAGVFQDRLEMIVWGGN